MKRLIWIMVGVLVIALCAAAQDVGVAETTQSHLLAANAAQDPATAAKLKSDLDKLVSESQFVTTVSPKMLLSPVAGAPYSAEEVTEFTQTLADGTRIHTEDRVTVYRDSAGRVRRETPQEISISDPVAGVAYSLNPKTQTARKMVVVMPHSTGSTGENEGKMFYFTTGTVASDGVVKLNVQKKALAEATAAGDKAKIDAEQQALAASQAKLADELKVKTIHAEADPGNVLTIREKNVVVHTAKGEALGMKNIEGVIAEGTRNVETIEAGAIGNDRPIQVVNERWYSDQLKTMVMTTHIDPRSGDESFRLTNIRLGEPDAGLFQVPAGYRMSGLN